MIDDDLIPLLAAAAFARARERALAISGHVLEVHEGNLVETFADGTRRIIRALPAPIAINAGARRRRIMSQRMPE